MLDSKDRPEFELVPWARKPKGGKPLPESILSVGVAPPHLELITIHVKVKIKNGKNAWVVYAVSPNKNWKHRKVGGKSWKELGIKEGVSRIVRDVKRKAKAEHLRRAKQYATLGLPFGDIK
jgi:hypothetical protein